MSTSGLPGYADPVVTSPLRPPIPAATQIPAPHPARSLTGAGAATTTSGAHPNEASATAVAPVPMSQLRSSVGRNDKQRAYAEEILIQEKPRSLSKFPIEPVTKDFEKSNASSTTAEDVIKLAQPPLNALISVDRNLNPYGLESEYTQQVCLRDTLIAASEGNLDILRTVSGLQAQKWRVLNAYTGYLPNLSIGFNEVGLNSVSSIPITAIARASTAGLSAGTSAASSGTIVTSAQTDKTIVDTPLTVIQTGFNWKPIQGGKLIYTALAEKHRMKAFRAELNGNISDTFLNCAKDYYNLVLADALLQIRTSAVETSAEQVRQNSALETAGLATNLDVLQSKTQLSKDRQNLINQQRDRRRSAVELAHLLNANLGQDLKPTDRILRKVRLVSTDVSVTDLLKRAIDNRPELKQYEELRQAAKKAIMISSASLLPSVSLSGSIIGLASNIGRMEPTYMLNFGVNWRFDGLGTTATTNIQANRWQARQALIDANQKFSDVFQQVRNSYNDCFTADSAVEETSNAVVSATEELRLARLRLDTGLGTNLDVLTAQRDLTQARIDKAQAIVNFNIAEVQLVHDIGLSSVDNFTSGRLISSATTR